MDDNKEESIKKSTIEEKITVKDPRRVEQGKKLAAISKQAKEDKMRKKIEDENFSYLPYIIYTVAGVSTFGFVYLLLFKGGDDVKLEPVKIVKSEKSEKPRFENLG